MLNFINRLLNKNKVTAHPTNQYVNKNVENNCNFCDFHNRLDMYMEFEMHTEFEALQPIMDADGSYAYHGYPTKFLDTGDAESNLFEDHWHKSKIFILYRFKEESQTTYEIETIERKQSGSIISYRKVDRCPNCNRRLD